MCTINKIQPFLSNEPRYWSKIFDLASSHVGVSYPEHITKGIKKKSYWHKWVIILL